MMWPQRDSDRGHTAQEPFYWHGSTKGCVNRMGDRIWHIYRSVGCDWGELMDREERWQTAGQRVKTDGRSQMAGKHWGIPGSAEDKTVTVIFFFCWQLMTPVSVLWNDTQKWHRHHNKYGASYADSLPLMRWGTEGTYDEAGQTLANNGRVPAGNC